MSGVARVWFEDSWRTCVYHVGRTRLHVVLRGDIQIQHVSMPKEAERSLMPVLLKDKPYPIKRAAKVLRAMPCGATKGALEHLKLALAGGDGR